MSAAAFFAKRETTPPEPFRKTKAVHALTSSATNEAYTPPNILAAARAALGGTIDLDPCSNAVANEEVQARTFYDAASNGLFLPWQGTVWLNPPGGFVNRSTLLPAKRGMSQACAWWRKLLDEYRAERVKAACFYTFRLDVLQNIQALDGYEPPHAYPFCIFKHRPRHWDARTPRELRGRKGQPTHACAVFFLPATRAEFQSRNLFQEAFAPLGFIR
jgi:hypothetical protein